MSRVLVFLQFFLIALVAYPFERPTVNILNLTLFCGGLIVFALAYFAMKATTFTIMPEPKPGGELITSGIYRYVRHPMYLAVLLCAIGASLAYGSSFKWMISVVLLCVLVTKLRYEEKLLAERFAAYAEYRTQSKALLPFLF